MFSRAQQACQGILAGCTHATTMLMVLPARSIKLTTTVAKEVRPRDLVDDVALSWMGLAPRGARSVATACHVVCESVAPWVSPCSSTFDKSDHLALTRQTVYHPESFASMLKIAGKHHMRYFGHDPGAVAAVRGMQKDRLKMHGRKAIIRALQLGAGRAKAARIWTTGVLPSVGHGAAVSGINDSGLKQMRSVAGSVRGFSGSGSLCRSSAHTTRSFTPHGASGSRIQPGYGSFPDRPRTWSRRGWR
eukprot:5777675-Pyramimonas_sp.AAC.1